MAPALRRALALGEGGGNTRPEECEASVLALAGVAPVVLVSLGEEPAVALPLSEPAPLGIWTLSLGRTPPMRLFVRDGGGMLGSEEVDAVRWGCFGSACWTGFGGDVPFVWAARATAPTSIDWDRGFTSSLIGASCLRGSGLSFPQTAASMERLSSIGVKILWFLADAGNGFG